ncbi:MAG: hypothetical protein HFH48_02650 [Lachnospiraceae bacterium]|nr:hypothetical protein [Lachnospiraceae bacterium]
MAYVRFLGDEAVHKAIVIPNEDENIVTLKFEKEKEVNTSGFNLFLDEDCEVDIGGDSYRGYTTMYRNDETTEEYNGYQLSNDGNVYVPPEPEPEPEPYEPTLEELKEQKIAEMNGKQQELIQKGVDVPLSNGTTERFTLKDQDQMSLMGLQTLAAQGVERIPWHEADNSEHCKYYSAEDMSRITGSALSFISFQVTYFRDLRIYINSMLDKESVQSVEYGMYIPSEYQSEVLADFYTAKNNE